MDFETFLMGFVVGFLCCGWLLSRSNSTESSPVATTESQLAEYQRLLLIAQTQQQITDVTASTRNNVGIHSLDKKLSQLAGDHYV